MITANNGGYAGIQIDPYVFGSLSANQTVYDNLRLQNNGDFLYAPTMKGPGQSCLEATTIYSTATPFVGFWDFCIANNSVFHNAKTVDSTFESNYVRDLGDGVPMYTVDIVVDPANPLGWHGALYNYSTGLWEDIYADSGNGTEENGFGWSIFETHYYVAGETCTVVPLIEADNITMDGTPLTYSNTGPKINQADCFTGTDPYIIQLVSNYHWIVQSDPSDPTPAPDPGDGTGGNCGTKQCIIGGSSVRRNP